MARCELTVNNPGWEHGPITWLIEASRETDNHETLQEHVDSCVTGVELVSFRWVEEE